VEEKRNTQANIVETAGSVSQGQSLRGGSGTLERDPQFK